MILTNRARILRNATTSAERALTKVYLRGDVMMRYVVLAHILIGFGLATFYSTWAISLPAIILAGGLFFGTELLFPAQIITRIMAGIVLQMFVILHIYQMHGLAEMHFFFFTATTAMIFYQDRRAILPGVILIISQHLAFAILHNQGRQVYFFEDRTVDWVKLVFHFSIALAQALLCSGIAGSLRRKTIADAMAKDKLLERQTELQASRRSLTATLAIKNEELSQARELQLSIMPESSLRIQGWELQAQMQTCLEVGGDYFDYKVIGEGHAVIAVGDATGHGMKAAIVVAAAKAVFQRMAGQYPLPTVFREISLALQGLGIRGTYMGLILIDIRPNKAQIVASGMPPVLLKNAATGQVRRVTEPGPFIGFQAETVLYPEAEVDMADDDLLLAFSDGLSERFNSQQKMLGWEPIAQLLANLHGKKLVEDVDRLLLNSMDWERGNLLPDDVTVMLARAVPMEVQTPLKNPSYSQGAAHPTTASSNKGLS